MFKFLQKLFFPKEEKQTEYISAIKFLISRDGHIDIQCEWPSFDHNNSDKIKDVAYFYAIAIHAINNGFLEKDTINTLRKYNTDNPFNSLFVHNVLMELINIEKISKKNDPSNYLPIISPTEVFKHSS